MSVRQNILDMSIDDFHKLHYYKLQNTFNKMIDETGLPKPILKSGVAIPTH